MSVEVGVGDVTERRKTDECSRDWENRSFNKVPEERKSRVTPSGIGDDNNIAWLKSEFGDEMIVPGNGIDQGSGERVGSGEWSG